MSLLNIVPAIMSVVSTISSINSQKKKDDEMRKAGDFQRKVGNLQYGAMEDVDALGRQYDPYQAANMAASRAGAVAGDALERSIRNIKARFGDTADTNFAISTQDQVNRITDPLKEFTAHEYANAPLKKIQARQAVFSAPAGQIADSHFRSAASMPGGNVAGSVGFLMQALERIKRQGGGAGSPGGSGGGFDGAGSGGETGVPTSSGGSWWWS